MLDILYEDKNMIACVKSCGISSQRDEKSGYDMLTVLDGYFKENNDNSTAYPVHRLDSAVGGVMVYAKNKAFAARLSELIAKTSGDEQKMQGEECFTKEYLAVIHGVPKEKSGMLCDLLYHDKRRNKTFVVDRERKGVKKALLYYETLGTQGDTSLVHVRLITGRTHQIRVQFASRKMPLVGDGRYGARDNVKEMGLWSYKITLALRGQKRQEFSKLPQGEIWSQFAQAEIFSGKIVDKAEKV